MKVGHLNIDGSVEIKASKAFFVTVGIRSAAIGAAIGWLLQTYLSWSWLSYSVAAVFGFWAIRAFIQGLFGPGFLTLRFSRSSISGPCVWWLFSDEIALQDVDWERSGIMLGRLVVNGRDSQQVVTRLGWYGPEGAAEIERQWSFLHSMAGGE